MQYRRRDRARWSKLRASPGIAAALAAALLFGASTPLAKALLASTNPWLLAGLLYLGSGLGLALFRLVRGASSREQLQPAEWPWLGGAILSGGVIAPVLLMFGLTGMSGSTASLLLNAEGVFTALLAWFVFRENVDRRVAIGMIAIVAGALVLTWSDGDEVTRLSSSLTPILLVLGACLAWALDNNLTRKVSLADATWIACIKGLVAGSSNLALAFIFGHHLAMPSLAGLGTALAVGCVAYGISLSLFVLSLRHLGTARTGAYFSVAPFFGAVFSIWLLDDAMTVQLAVAGVLMAIGVVLHLSERHEHEHIHERLEHEHSHGHDEHHQHEHPHSEVVDGEHTHAHRHEPLTHRHTHYPDAHHRHDH